MNSLKKDDEKFLINNIIDNKTIESIKQNIGLTSQIVKTINDDLKAFTSKVEVQTMTMKTRKIELVWDGEILKVNLSELESSEKTRVMKDICHITRELVSHKRKLLVYRLENEKLDYNMTSSVIHEQNLKKIKNELRRVEKNKEEKERIEFKEYMREIREKQITNYKNKLSEVALENDELRSKLLEEMSEAKKLNEKINGEYKEMTDIKTKLGDLLKLREKLEDSKKAVIKLIKDQPNKNEYLSEMKTNGFILSYAGCLKIALKKAISSKDIVHKEHGENMDSIIKVIKLQEDVYLKKLERFKMLENDNDDEDVGDFECD